MKYNNIVRGEFVKRHNRFIATVHINGQDEIVHVKNTGRCAELLVEGAEVWLEKSDNPARKTAYDLVTVKKDSRLINMDSQAPNKAVSEWLKECRPFGDMEIFPEKTWGNSRFDFMLKSIKTDRIMYLEVKGCTLERDGAVFFPDAPTERGTKHLNELIECRRQGIDSAVMILVQMGDILYFSPNDDTDTEFGKALRNAEKSGVKLLCYDSIVTPDTLTVGKPVEIRL
ncbi:DNA/RNA nuclease SfsA [Ruminococcus sp.]|uniref:DNA/RNA nuclease SfsA n=1 Tax=Ruminococcus sp. TaxID=41978 RepID=UPI0025F7CC9F|nr:DNA/RNA nuclease SfsA [Ruminococcus sp.]MBQ8966420.1 DNA/RNA nuclease SfsA [Ruminococcus sp.]